MTNEEKARDILHEYLYDHLSGKYRQPSIEDDCENMLVKMAEWKDKELKHVKSAPYVEGHDAGYSECISDIIEYLEDEIKFWSEKRDHLEENYEIEDPESISTATTISLMYKHILEHISKFKK